MHIVSLAMNVLDIFTWNTVWKNQFQKFLVFIIHVSLDGSCFRQQNKYCVFVDVYKKLRNVNCTLEVCFFVVNTATMYLCQTPNPQVVIEYREMALEIV